MRVQRRVTAVILAGGASTRFGGRDKAFALWQGKPFLAHVGEAVRSVSDSVLILVPPRTAPEPYARLVPGASVVPDRAEHAGPVKALRGATVLIRTPTVLVAPCDAPGLTGALARRLVAFCEESGRPAIVHAPSGPIFSLFALPNELLGARLATAARLEELVHDAQWVDSDAEGLNVNEPPR